MALTSQQNYALTRTELDGIFYQVYENVSQMPGHATCETAEIFKPMSIDRQAYITETYGGLGLLEQTGEMQTNSTDNVVFGNKIVRPVLDWTKNIDISKNYFDDDFHGTYTKIIQDMARVARATQSTVAFGLFRNAWTTTLTNDGLALAGSHNLLKGGTFNVDLGAGGAFPLSPANLNTGITTLLQQPNEANVVLGCMPSILLVELSILKYALEITESALIADSGNNNINVFRSSYGFKVFSSPYMGQNVGTPAGAWFLLSDNHSVTRMVRQGIETFLRPWGMSNNRTYNYQMNYRESYFVENYVGIVAGKN